MISFAQSAPIELDLHGFSNTTEKEFLAQIQAGKRFVVYHYAMSVVFYSFQHATKIHVVESRGMAVVKGLPWTLLTLLLGWWAIPFGPIYTLISVYWNFSGGTDVSGEILDHIRKQDPRHLYGWCEGQLSFHLRHFGTELDRKRPANYTVVACLILLKAPSSGEQLLERVGLVITNARDHVGEVCQWFYAL